MFAVSDLYQDVFGEGSFTGKGLYHIDAVEAALKGRIAENAVLSHDLLEGALARAALVTDVEVVEDYPTRYPVDASRQHRWARGDWQLLGYIFDPTIRRAGAVALEDGRQSAPLADADLLGHGVDRRLDAAALHPGRAVAGAADPGPVHGADLRDHRRHPAEEPRGHRARPFQRAGRAMPPSAPRWWRCASC